MPKLNELSPAIKMVIAVGIAALVGGGIYMGVVKPMEADNDMRQQKLDAVLAENKELKQFETRMPELERQIASLLQQIEIQKRIVPDTKEPDQFMRLMQETAAAAGIEVRRYTAKPTQTREFYNEMPFEMDIDGPYYGLLNFFERVTKVERIVNVNNLQVASTGNARAAKVKNVYTYTPTQTVVASFTATTFFANNEAPKEEAPKGKGKTKGKAKGGAKKEAAAPAKK